MGVGTYVGVSDKVVDNVGAGNDVETGHADRQVSHDVGADGVQTHPCV